MKDQLNKFIDACILKGQYEEIGNARKGNQQYNVINSVYRLLKREARLMELLALLEHEDPYVRLWSAGYTLQIEPLQSEKVLESLGNIIGKPVGFSAKMVLHEWRKGNLNFS